MNAQKYYVTTPIYYANSKPHLGTLYSSIIADVVARFAKLSGKEVFFLTGTDEHGQKIQEKAQQQNITPKQLVDSMIEPFKKVWKAYEIEYNQFIRTTDDAHKKAVTKLIEQLKEQGDIYKAEYSGWYCVPCETFVTLEDGDERLCPACSRELRELTEENYFFRLSAYQDRLLEFYEEHSNFIMPKERMNEVISFVKSGLKDLSISRKGVTWGIPFPGDSEHTVYVWMDALTNYISALGYGQDNSPELFKKFWPANVHVMAKDIVRFHAIYWPAFLMAADIPLPKQLLVHGYILSGDTKMSKSLGNVIDPLTLAQEYGHEQVRYYLVRKMAASHDGHFTTEDLEACIAADLANNVGNLLSRMTKLAQSNNLETITPPSTWEPTSLSLHAKCADAYHEYWDDMQHARFHTALAAVWKFASHTNAYFNEHKPWALAKTNPDFFAEVMSATTHALHAIAIMAWPVMPQKMAQLLESIGMPFADGTDYTFILRENKWDKSFVCSPLPTPLFPRPEKKNMTPEKQPVAKAAPEEKKDTNITIHDFIKVELVAGTITSCENVEGSDKLYKLSVELGSYGTRQILSGVRKNLTPEQLIGKQGVVVANLPPRKMVGLMSEGMMLFAKDDQGAFELVTTSGPVADGTRLS